MLAFKIQIGDRIPNEPSDPPTPFYGRPRAARYGSTSMSRPWRLSRGLMGCFGWRGGVLRRGILGRSASQAVAGVGAVRVPLVDSLAPAGRELDFKGLRSSCCDPATGYGAQGTPKAGRYVFNESRRSEIVGLWSGTDRRSIDRRLADDDAKRRQTPGKEAVLSVDVRMVKQAAERGGPALAGVPGAAFLMLDREFRILLAAGPAVRDEVRSGVQKSRMSDVLPRPRGRGCAPGMRRRWAASRRSLSTPHRGMGRRIGCGSRRLWSGSRIVGVTVLTQETSTERLLAEHEKRRAAVSEALEEGVLILDRELGVVSANQAACRILDFDLLPASFDSEWWTSLRPRDPE